MLSVQAWAPVEIESAVSVVVGDEAPDAVVSITSMTCDPEIWTSACGDGSVALQAIAPPRMAMTSATGVDVVLLAAARTTATVPSAATFRCPSPATPRPGSPGPPGPGGGPPWSFATASVAAIISARTTVIVFFMGTSPLGGRQVQAKCH